MFNILIVEDDPDMREVLSAVFTNEGYRSFTAKNGLEAFEIIENEYIDLIITDIMMPGMDGYEFSSAIRDAGYDFPILMITAKSRFDDLEKGFNSGADDYMVKPINIKELILRAQALLRRAKINSEKKITVGRSVFDYDSLTANINGEVQTLPQKEFYLIFKLLSHMDRIFTRQELMDEIWGMTTEADERTVNTHINRLRTRFANCDDFEIVTVRGLGYKAVKKC